MSERRHEWTSPSGGLFSLDVSVPEAPRLQLWDDGWCDVHPKIYPQTIFEELANVLSDGFDAQEKAARRKTREDEEDAVATEVRADRLAEAEQQRDGLADALKRIKAQANRALHGDRSKTIALAALEAVRDLADAALVQAGRLPAEPVTASVEGEG